MLLIAYTENWCWASNSAEPYYIGNGEMTFKLAWPKLPMSVRLFLFYCEENGSLYFLKLRVGIFGKDKKRQPSSWFLSHPVQFPNQTLQNSSYIVVWTYPLCNPFFSGYVWYRDGISTGRQKVYEDNLSDWGWVVTRHDSHVRYLFSRNFCHNAHWQRDFDFLVCVIPFGRTSFCRTDCRNGRYGVHLPAVGRSLLIANYLSR